MTGRRRRLAGAGQGVRGVGAGPDGYHRQAGLERRASAAGARAGARARALLNGRHQRYVRPLWCGGRVAG